ncbi:MAG: hypothetical protein IJB02_00090 [Oscillospiraceae bacterium]|nr:hypothetical protein [Oscillospiraceae bacterium]
MNHKIAAYGLAEGQISHLEASLTEGYKPMTAECVTDLLVADAICVIVDATQMRKDALNTLLAYYMDVGDWLDETVVWLGDAELPDLPSFVRCDSFLELLTELKSILTRAQVHYDTMQMYGSEYAYLPKRAIEESLEGDIYSALHRKYGEKPDSLILKRMRQEWTALLESGNVADLAAVYELTSWLKRNQHPYKISGDATSGLIPYLLGITNVNPLPPHLHCPKCHRTIWQPAYTDGFDIPPINCCDVAMIPDGHNLVWQSYCSYGNNPVYDFSLPEDMREQIEHWLDNHWLKLLKSDIWDFTASTEAEYIQRGNLFFEFTLNRNRIAKDFHTKAITAENRNYITRIGKAKDIPSPNCVGEMIALLCLADDNNAWDKYSAMLRDGTLKLSELISCREDIFFYLKAHGFVDKDAFRGMNWVRKGRGFPVITDEMRASEDNWVLTQCEKCRRLPSKATILEYLFFMLKALISPELLDS